MAAFYKTMVKLLQTLLFESKVIKFVFSCIPRFETEIPEKNALTSVPKWNFPTYVPLKTLNMNIKIDCQWDT